MGKDEDKGKIISNSDLSVKGSVVWWEDHWSGKQKACDTFYSCSQWPCVRKQVASPLCVKLSISVKWGCYIGWLLRSLGWNLMAFYLPAIQNEKKCAEYAVYLRKKKNKAFLKLVIKHSEFGEILFNLWCWYLGSILIFFSFFLQSPLYFALA